jgi:hypothetical protein
MTTKTKEVHVVIDPGTARDHQASTDCWCRPSRAVAIEESGQATFLHQGAATRIVRFTEARR